MDCGFQDTHVYEEYYPKLNSNYELITVWPQVG